MSSGQIIYNQLFNVIQMTRTNCICSPVCTLYGSIERSEHVRSSFFLCFLSRFHLPQEEPRKRKANVPFIASSCLFIARPSIVCVHMLVAFLATILCAHGFMCVAFYIHARDFSGISLLCIWFKMFQLNTIPCYFLFCNSEHVYF